MKALRGALAFLHENTPQSMTRLTALLCCLAGCVVALRFPEHWQTVASLIGGGTVALLTRKKSTEPAPEAEE